MTNVLQSIVELVREDLSASSTPSDVRALATRRVRGLIESTPEFHNLDERALISSTVDELAGFGALQPFLDDPSIEEIWINAPNAVFIARAGIAQRTSVVFEPHQIRHLVERMLASSGRRVDASSPFVDASLPDGSRLHVVIPDITSRHWSVNIRKFSRTVASLDDLVAGKSLSRKLASLLESEITRGTNVLVSGATAAGKTTLPPRANPLPSVPSAKIPPTHAISRPRHPAP